MKKEDCFYLGKVARKHSFKGEVVVALDTDEPQLYADIDAVFVDMGKNLIPFFIEKSLLQKGNQLRVKFEDINSEKDAEALLKRDIYLPLEVLPKLEGNKFYYHEVIGYTVKDSVHGELGKITAINDQSAQHLFVVENQSTEILIPLIDQFIKKVDRRNKTIEVDTPDGLVELYLDQ